MNGRSDLFVVVMFLSLSVFLIGCDGIASPTITNTGSDGTDCSNYITASQSKDLINTANKYVEITNLCFGRDTPQYSYNNELASSGSSNDKCASEGMLSVIRANQLVDVTNKLISDANRCTGGSNYPPVQPLDKFGGG